MATANSPFVGGLFAFPAAAAGVGVAQHDAADQAAQVIAVLGRVASQPIEQFRMARRVLAVDLIERHHQAAAEEAMHTGD